jgi:hypothetical protein
MVHCIYLTFVRWCGVMAPTPMEHRWLRGPRYGPLHAHTTPCRVKPKHRRGLMADAPCGELSARHTSQTAPLGQSNLSTASGNTLAFSHCVRRGGSSALDGGGNNQGLRGGASSWGLHVMQRLQWSSVASEAGSRPPTSSCQKPVDNRYVQQAVVTDPQGLHNTSLTGVLDTTPRLLNGVSQHHHDP